jgi:hypothetical protein
MTRLVAAARRHAELLALALVVLAVSAELAARLVARASLLSWKFGLDVSPAPLLAAVFTAGAVALMALRLRRRLTADLTLAVVLLCALPAGLAAQRMLGARLQSDGFFYFAHLRSLWFDHDQDLTNDYIMLGMGSKAYLFRPTPTGHAQSAWTIGPTIVWAPFFAAGDVVAHVLRARGHEIAIDGTSFPYRQAVCVAGLVWGLVGLYFSFLIARRLAAPAWAAGATIAVGSGSFLLWYLVKEPTMTHAPSMAAVAIFTWGWLSTRDRRSPWQWAALGLAAGLMVTVRWQNVLFALLPAVEWTATAWGVRTDRTTLGRHVRLGALFTVCAVIGFLPQMLVWRAIYGAPLAVSPIGPQIRWWAPQIADVLWSSRNGLFATSPVLYVGAIGLVLCWWRDRRFAVAALITFGAMAFFNSSVEDWWGSAAFGGRRFDGILPLLVAGTAVAAESATLLVRRRPGAIVVAACAGLVVWNLTYMAAALDGRAPIGEAVAFAPLAGYQAETVEQWTGHPFSWPANWWFAAANGLSPADYDLGWGLRILSNPKRPYGKIDLGEADATWVEDGWYPPERRQETSFRWATRTATLKLFLDHSATLRVQTRALALSWPGAPAQSLTLLVNGHPQPAVAVSPDWTVLEQQVPADEWRRGLNRLTFSFSRETRPLDVGLGNDARTLAAAVDYVRVAVQQP